MAGGAAGVGGGAAALEGLSDAALTAPPPSALPPAAALTAATSSVWPIPLALLVGLIIGIAVGFFIFGSRDNGDAVAATPPVAETTTAAASSAPAVPQPSAGAANPASESRVAGATATSGSTSGPPSASGPTSARETADAPPGATSGATSGTTSAAARGPATANDAPERAERTAPRATPSGATAAASARRPTTAGRLLVRSSPAGARVLLDGKDVGATPLTLRALAFGSHTVRLTRTGFAAEERRITMSATQPAQSVVVDLAPTRDRGASDARADGAGARPSATAGAAASLIIDSRPAGAAVYIDGRRVGTTPATIDNVRLGQHTVFLELEGFRGWSALMQFASGENRVSATLEP